MNLGHANNPYFNKAVRLTQGLLTFQEACALSNLTAKRATTLLDKGLFPKPKVTSKSGRHNLWDQDLIKKYAEQRKLLAKQEAEFLPGQPGVFDKAKVMWFYGVLSGCRK